MARVWCPSSMSSKVAKNADVHELRMMMNKPRTLKATPPKTENRNPKTGRRPQPYPTNGAGAGVKGRWPAS